MKKKLFVLIFAFISCFGNGQIVNIPDANFKAYLIDPAQGIDTNGDGEIQQSEAGAAQYLFIDNLGIQSLTGIEAFNNVVFFDCSYNQLTSIDVSALLNLEGLYCKYNQLTDLNVVFNTHLYDLFCSHNQITSISLPDIVLGDLDISYNQIQNIVLQSVEELLDVSGNPLTSLDLSPIDDEQLYLYDGPTIRVTNTGLESLLIPAIRHKGIYISDNSQMENISFRNGISDYCIGDPLGECSEFAISILDNPVLVRICVDDNNESGSEALYMQQHTSPIENVSITTDCALGTNTSNRHDFVITPNPAADFINIQSEGKSFSVNIYNLAGQKLMADIDRNQIDISTLASGIYLIEISSEPNRSIQKLIKL